MQFKKNRTGRASVDTLVSLVSPPNSGSGRCKLPLGGAQRAPIWSLRPVGAWPQRGRRAAAAALRTNRPDDGRIDAGRTCLLGKPTADRAVIAASAGLEFSRPTQEGTTDISPPISLPVGEDIFRVPNLVSTRSRERSSAQCHPCLGSSRLNIVCHGCQYARRSQHTHIYGEA